VLPRTFPLALYETSLVAVYLVGRIAGWWGGDLLAALGAAGMVTICALPMLLLWIAARRSPDDLRPRFRAMGLAAGVAVGAAVVVTWGDRSPGLLAAAISPLAAAMLLASGRRGLIDAGFLIGCYAVPAALLAAVLSALS
jgi:hypothetical protein